MTSRLSFLVPPAGPAHRRMMHRLGAAILCLSCAALPAPARAQADASVGTPGVVRYDGLAPAGTAGGTLVLTAALFDAETGGTLLWDETQTVVVDAGGRYTLFLGASRAGGLPASALAGDGPRRWRRTRSRRGRPFASMCSG